MKWFFDFKKLKTMKHGMHNNLKAIKKKLKKWYDQLIQRKKFKECNFKAYLFSRKLKYKGVSPFIICKPYSNWENATFDGLSHVNGMVSCFSTFLWILIFLLFDFFSFRWINPSQLLDLCFEGHIRKMESMKQCKRTF